MAQADNEITIPFNAWWKRSIWKIRRFMPWSWLAFAVLVWVLTRFFQGPAEPQALYIGLAQIGLALTLAMVYVLFRPWRRRQRVRIEQALGVEAGMAVGGNDAMLLFIAYPVASFGLGWVLWWVFRGIW